MKKTLALIALLLCASAHAQVTTTMSGTFSYPSGAAVNGQLAVKLEKSNIINNCVTPAKVVPAALAIYKVLNGALQGSPALIPTDCLSTFQPYLVTLTDTSHNQLFSLHWYVTQPDGALANPSNGNSWAYPAGLALSGQSLPVVYTIAFPGGQASASQATGTISSGSTTVVPIVWSTKFTSTTYTALCSVVDTATPGSPILYVTAISLTNIGASVSVHNGGGVSDSGTVYCRGHI